MTNYGIEIEKLKALREIAKFLQSIAADLYLIREKL